MYIFIRDEDWEFNESLLFYEFFTKFFEHEKELSTYFFFFPPQYESRVQQFLIFRSIFFRHISRLFFVLIENQYSPPEVRKKSFRGKKKRKKRVFLRIDVTYVEYSKFSLSIYLPFKKIQIFFFFFAKIPLFPPFHFRFQRLNDEATIPRASSNRNIRQNKRDRIESPYLVARISKV